MPDHVHLLIYFDDEKLTISKVIQNIKSHSARDIIDYYKKVGSREPLLSVRLGDQATRGAEESSDSRIEQGLNATRM